MEKNAATFSIISLGCAKNQVDAETMTSLLIDGGFVPVADPAQAEVIIVNTCGFIKSAKEEAIESIFDMAEYKKNGNCRALIVSGCLSERYGKDLFTDIPEADAFVGIGRIGEIVSIAEKALSGERFLTEKARYRFVKSRRAALVSPNYAYLKVSDGCDNRCAYCAIPGIRGPFISRPIDDVLREARELADSGVREIIPIAQDTTRYGADLYGKSRIIDLLGGLSEIPGVKWIRPMYFYPDAVSRELIDFMAENGKICNYIDLPIQHIDDGILSAMNRRGDGALIKDIVSCIRKKADFALRTTVIAGFPGETKAQFDTLLDFIKKYPFDRLGAFAYSQEEDTPASLMDGQVREAVKKSRAQKIMAAQREISAGLLKKRVGTECEVILESIDSGGRFVARSMLEAPDVDGCIYVSGDNIDIGQYVNVKITESFDYDLRGVAL